MPYEFKVGDKGRMRCEGERGCDCAGRCNSVDRGHLTMCLTIDQNIHPDFKPIKLRNDNVVWKCLLADDNRSLIMDFKYHRGCTYSVESMTVKGHVDSIMFPPRVARAFHAYTTKRTAVAAILIPNMLRKCAVRKFIIPAGSLVYYGTDGDICSDRIRFPHTARSAIKAWQSRKPKE